MSNRPVALPNSIANLVLDEDRMRSQALEWIKNDPDLTTHLALVERCMDIAWRFAMQPADTEAERTLQPLGYRLFNSMAASLRLALCGYFQSSGLVQRDLYETGWLASYLHSHPDRIPSWREANTYEKRKPFTPDKIRKALNSRDRFTHDPRSPLYWELCDLAAHPSFEGFALLGPPGNAPNCGPFMDIEALHRTMESLCKASAIAAANLSGLMQLGDASTDTALGRLYMAINEWNERFMDTPFPSEKRREIVELFDLA